MVVGKSDLRHFYYQLPAKDRTTLYWSVTFAGQQDDIDVRLLSYERPTRGRRSLHFPLVNGNDRTVRTSTAEVLIFPSPDHCLVVLG